MRKLTLLLVISMYGHLSAQLPLTSRLYPTVSEWIETAPAEDGGYYAMGRFSGTSGSNNMQTIVAKFNAQGDLDWSKSYTTINNNPDLTTSSAGWGTTVLADGFC
jgi:hypothetical protein